jgi:hypothetical protein
MAQQEHPLIEVGFELVEGFGELGQFDVNKFQLFVEDFAVLVLEFDDMEEGVIAFVVIENEIEDADAVDRAKFKVPLAFERLFLDGEGGVVDAAIFKEVLFSFLDFDDKPIAVFGLTVNVEDGFTVDRCTAKILGVFERQILNMVMGGQKRVEEVDQQTFMRFCPEDAFEAKVGEETDVTILKRINHGAAVAVYLFLIIAIDNEV